MNCAVPVARLRRDRLLHAATKAFGSREVAEAWCRKPLESLGGRTPFEAADVDESTLDLALAELP